MSRHALVLLTLSLAATVFGVTPLAAQDVEIVVTATKEPTPAQTLPVGVTVIDAEELAASSTVAEALSRTLAVRLKTETPGQATLVAPGFGENGFGRVALLVDGSPQNRPDMAPAPLDLIPVFAVERIEIVQGAASALWGDQAVAGAVNVVTRVPEKTEFHVSTTLESTLTNRQSLGFGVPVGEGGFLLSVQRNLELPVRDRSDSGNYQLWSKLEVPGISDDQRWTAWVAATKADYQLPGSLTKAQYEADPNQTVNKDDQGERTESRGGLTWVLERDTWGLSLPLHASWQKVHSAMVSYPSYNETSVTQGALEPRAHWVLGSFAAAEVETAVGLGVSVVRLTSDRYSTDFGKVVQRTDVDRASGSLWNRWSLNWGDTWMASALVRLEASRTQARSAESPSVDGQKVFWPLSGQAGVTWVPQRGQKYGLEASRVFRYPFVDELVVYSGYGSDTFLTDLDPEVGHGLSAVASWSLGPLVVDASATALRMENEVAYENFRPRNLGPTWHGRGLVSLRLTPVEGVEVGAEYAPEVARFASGANNGKVVPLVPGHRGRAWAGYRAGLIALEASWTGSSEFYEGGDGANAKDLIPGRQSIDASASLTLGSPDLRLRVYGTNLGDDRTPVSVYYSGWYPLEGRVFGAALAWDL